MASKKKQAAPGELIKQDLINLPSNTELKQLIEKLMIRFENWKLEAERNPNPRMVHSMKNIISMVDTLTGITDSKMRYSYKMLSRQMSLLIDSMAKLNLTITDSLMDDDLIDEAEEKQINDSLMAVVQGAVELIKMVQQSFGVRKS